MEYQNNNPDNNYDSQNESSSYNENYYNNNNMPNGNSGLAIASMVCGILSIIFCCCYGIVGLILGIISVILVLNFRKSNNGFLNGQALAGIICATIGIILSLVMFIYVIYVISHYNEFLNLLNWTIRNFEA